MSTKVIEFKPGQIISGHSSIFDDQLDVSEELGVWRWLYNTHPGREGFGKFFKRKAQRLALERPSAFSADRIVRQIVQPGKTIQISGADVVRDLLWQMQSDADVGNNQYQFGLEKYTPAKFYTSGNWSGTWETCNEGAGTDGTSFYVYPGLSDAGNDLIHGYSGEGIWLLSKRGHVSMPMGAYGRGTATNVKYAIPMKGLFIYRNPAAPYFDGFFADPQSVTGGDHAGTVTVTKFAIVPEKPTFYATGITLGVYMVLPHRYFANHLVSNYVISPGNANVFRQSGKCYPGRYKFYLCPVDEIGDIGAPLLIQEASFPIMREGFEIYLNNLAGLDPIPGRPHLGVSLFFDLAGITDDITANTFIPNIRSFIIYGTYDPEDPTSSIWTKSTDQSGFELPKAPEPKRGVVAEFDLNGRQFDPNDSTAWSGTRWTALATAHKGWTHSTRFNRFLLKQGFTARAKRLNTTTLEVKNDYVFNWQFSKGIMPITAEIIPGLGASERSGDDMPRIEIIGKFGVSAVVDWTYIAATEKIQLTVANTLPGANGDYFDIRFCNTWEDDTGTRSIRFQTNDPETWDDSVEFPFPDEVTTKFDLWYPKYTGQCENSIGTERLIWDYFVNGIRTKNRLLTNDDSWSRFPIDIEVPGNITGACFLDNNYFIVTTGESAWLGRKWIDDEGYKQIEIVRKLKYGHRGYQIIFNNEIAYGFDPKYGAWMITLDSSRIRQDITPYGDQVLMMPKALQKEVESICKTLIDEELDSINLYAGQGTFKIFFPALTGAASGGGKNNINMRSPQAFDSFWLSYYDEEKMWSFDFAVGAEDAIESTADDGASTHYVVIAATGHGRSAGDKIVVYGTKNCNGVYAISAVPDVDHLTIPVTWLESETGYFRLMGVLPIFRAGDGVSGVMMADTQTYFTRETDVPLSNSGAEEEDVTTGSGQERPIGQLISTPEFRSPSYIGKDFIRNMDVDLQKQGVQDISVNIVTIPYHDRVRKPGIQKSVITATGRQNGINVLGNTFRVEVTDFSDGTPGLNELRLNINDLGRAR